MSLVSVVSNLDPKTGFVHPAYFEAYCTSDGRLDAGVVGRVCNQRFTQKSLNSQINKLVGAASFVPDPEIELELISFDEFKQMYEFGKFPHIRDYIIEAYETTGKLLTRENLFNWVVDCG